MHVLQNKAVGCVIPVQTESYHNIAGDALQHLASFCGSIIAVWLSVSGLLQWRSAPHRSGVLQYVH